MQGYFLKRLAWIALGLLVLAAEVLVWLKVEDRLPIFILAALAPQIIWGVEVFAARYLARRAARAPHRKPRSLAFGVCAVWGATMLVLVLFGIETAASLFAAHLCASAWIDAFRDLLFEPDELDRDPPA